MQILVKRFLIHKGEMRESYPIRMQLACFRRLQAFLPGIYQEEEMDGRINFSKIIYSVEAKDNNYDNSTPLWIN